MTERPNTEAIAGGKILRIDHGTILEIRLHRPDVHNALDEEVIEGLTEVFRGFAASGVAAGETGTGSSVPANKDAGSGARTAGAGTLRGVLLTSSGKTFCSGADVNYMRRVASYQVEENRQDARRLSAMFRAVRECPVYVLARVQGAALGGGSGLIACCDRVVASREARFGFTEARLGIVPAVISPFVLDRIGPAHGRALFVTGEVFDAAEALRIGLVDRVVEPDQLDAAVDAIVQNLLHAAPFASMTAKALVQTIGPHLPFPFAPRLATRSVENAADVFEATAQTIAQLRASLEGREGLSAFLEKRRPDWSTEFRRVPEPPA